MLSKHSDLADQLGSALNQIRSDEIEAHLLTLELLPVGADDPNQSPLERDIHPTQRAPILFAGNVPPDTRRFDALGLHNWRLAEIEVQNSPDTNPMRWLVITRMTGGAADDQRVIVAVHRSTATHDALSVRVVCPCCSNKLCRVTPQSSAAGFAEEYGQVTQGELYLRPRIREIQDLAASLVSREMGTVALPIRGHKRNSLTSATPSSTNGDAFYKDRTACEEKPTMALGLLGGQYTWPEDQTDWVLTLDPPKRRILLHSKAGGSEFEVALNADGGVICKTAQTPEGWPIVHPTGCIRCQTAGDATQEPAPTMRRRRGDSLVSILKASAPALNQPGHWDVMISYTQRHAVSETLAHMLHAAFEKRGKSAWLDVKMARRDEAAMKEAVENSRCIIAIISGDDPSDKNVYFNRDFCLKELRWAKQAGTFVQPIVSAEDKDKISAMMQLVPSDLQHLKGVNWEHIDRKDSDYFELGVTKIIRAAGPEPEPEPEPQPVPQPEPQPAVPEPEPEPLDLSTCDDGAASAIVATANREERAAILRMSEMFQDFVADD